ncbi:poly(ADP-ribose) glycohydrolase [Asbolus verrucosus]|uniref:poly(ADP-ribose) glycohydrolase n=1 Tax=Asbolus verrucosus TaxID=1661398 RepID=A0A482VBX9_ASBVE|nr:poly(ADP-ribose) glycohydrolase [Asbolus verrucosus]
MCDKESEKCTWLGTSLSDMYRGQGPWHFSTTPVAASKYHHVLYELPFSLKEVPQPHHNSQPKHWDDDYVRMPYSSHSLFLVKQNGEETIKPRWDVICESLLKPINSIEELEKAINCYNNKLPKLTALYHFFNEVLEEEEVQYFFNNLLPNIVQLALQLPEFIPGSIPLLKKNHNKSINPVGVITFERKFVPRSHMPRWDTLDNNLGNTKIHITSSGTIEEGLGFLQVDFANKFIGGGVLGYGCVQEEIRFVICPELILSRLFTQELGDGEAIVITGVERYSNYSGYSDCFKWDGNVNDETPFDDYGRRKTSVAVIDAIRFTKTKDQFHCSTILRELNKAYVGFSSKEKNNLSPVATGNWGCGAFKGDPYLKSLIQLMACSAANRDLVYYSFGNTELRDEFYNMHLFLANNKFLCFNTQKRKTDVSLPSTSNNNEEIKTKKNVTSNKTTKNEESHYGASSQVKQVTNKNMQKKSESVTLSDKSPRKCTMSSEDVIHIINIMDGSANTPKESPREELTLLSEIDKLKKVSVNTELSHDKEGKVGEDATEIQMEVDNSEETSKPMSFIEDKKRKITDYFSKMTNHVNSYL